MTTDKKGVTISSSVFIRSLRGAGKKYPVLLNKNGLPFGSHYQLDSQHNIEKAHAFAGKGTDKAIRNAIFLENTYHIPVKEWQKCAGTGYVVKDGKSVKAELHWYQAKGKRFELKVKRWFEDES